MGGSEGPGRIYLEHLAEMNGISHLITFELPMDETKKNKLFASNLIYLQLSSHEGFGVAAAEAFFSGMPVVHTNRGGLSDVIGKRGIVIPFKDRDHIDCVYALEVYQLYLFVKFVYLY